MVMMCSQAAHAQASYATAVTADGTSDKLARSEAVRALPYNRLRPEVAKRIHDVVSHPTVFRRLPVSTIEAAPDLFVFLVRNPEVVIGIWKVMGVTSIDLKRTGQFRFNAHDGMGTASEIDLVYGTPNMHVYFGKGMYEGSLFKNKVFGQCVMLLRSVRSSAPDGQTTIRNVLDVFLKLDSPAIDLVARTFQPLFVKSADINFTETSKFLMKLSKTAEVNPSGVAELARKLHDVDVPVQDEFVRLANRVGENRSRPIPSFTARPARGGSQPERPAVYISRSRGLQTSRLDHAGEWTR